MHFDLKSLSDQTIVITGASSGIGLATARMAAERGARVVLVSRDETDLRTVAEEIRAAGGRAMHLVADVADVDALRAVAERTAQEFGGFDTWVNNAGVSIYGTIEEVGLDDARRLFETNYWGVVHGTLAALPRLKQTGGAIINVGSVLSSTGYPLQGHYTASKHAVKGFTDSLRIELEAEGAPVSVTLIQPAAIDTPYPQHARNYLDVEPKHQPPVYEPRIVAEAILDSAEHPRRDVLVGGSAKVFTATEKYMPAAGDRLKAATALKQQRSDQPASRTDTLWEPRAGDVRERGDHPGRVMGTSLYTKARLNRGKVLLGLAAAGAGVAWAMQRRNESDAPEEPGAW
jgi:short-subunit dehydrogenase